WLDAIDIHLRQLLDKSEDRVELALKVLDLVFSNRNAGEVRDTANGSSVDRHGSQVRRREPKQPLYQKAQRHYVPKLTIRTDFITLEPAVSVRTISTPTDGSKATTRTRAASVDPHKMISARPKPHRETMHAEDLETRDHRPLPRARGARGL